MQGGSIFTAALRDIFVCDERYRRLSFRGCYEKPRSVNANVIQIRMTERELELK